MIMLFTCLCLGFYILWQGQNVKGMNSHVSHFEYLTYDVYSLQEQHERVRRSASEKNNPIKLQFKSHGRFFDLRLVRDDTIFHPDAIIDTPEGSMSAEHVSHLYHGSQYGKQYSAVYGTIIAGIFRGVIEDPDMGNYYLEENFNFFGGTNGESPVSGYRGHSVIYHEDAVKFPKGMKYHRHCAADQKKVIKYMKKYIKSSDSKHEKGRKRSSRKKRQLDPEKTTCLLYIQSDYILYDTFENTEVIISKIAEHVKAVNRIYSTTEFTSDSGQPIRGLNFKVQRLRINGSETVSDPTNPFRDRNLGVEKFLDITSLANHNDYCLAYVFTNRDFDNGVLGLAWVGSARGSSGGICERYKVFSDRSGKSLNTGIVTYNNFGSIMPARVTHITFAHELGHNFGSPHDSGQECTPGESLLSSVGNYIMYAKATEGNKPNNVLFSPCSNRNMSIVLTAKKDTCFVSSDEPVCGNQIIDEGEECDCGYTDTCAQLGDSCCVPADDKANADNKCLLRDGMQCSITQGPCCNGENCQFQSSDFECSPLTECQLAQNCDAAHPSCPPPELIANNTVCMNETRVCLSGECRGSICLSKTGLEPCDCQVPPGSTDRSLLCHTCCQRQGDSGTCKSSGDKDFAQFFGGVTLFLQPGSACDDYKGYCDVFSKCRLVDADGPLSRLKQAIFNPEFYSNVKLWIIEYWWAVMLMCLAMVLMMAAFIKICSVRTPSSNPRLPKPKPFPGTSALHKYNLRHARLGPKQFPGSHPKPQPQHVAHELAHRP